MGQFGPGGPGRLPHYQYLRRSRLVDDTEPLSLRELVRELRTLA